jgi:hypothetical protein
MPRLTARALSELMALPGYEQYRVLYEQKYPKRGANAFKIPYYAPALRGIRGYYASGNLEAEIQAARIGLGSVGNLARRTHNERVLENFIHSQQAARHLNPIPMSRLAVPLGATELRPSLDLVASEGTGTRRIFYNMRVGPLSKDLARTTIEVAHWLLELCDLQVPITEIEYIDLAKGGFQYSFSTRRPATIRQAKQTLKLVETLWPTI